MAPDKILAFPTPADFDPNILAVIEPIWLAFANEEKLVSRWVTLLNRDGDRIGVDRQKNDGRSNRVGVLDSSKGLHATYEKKDQKSHVVTVSDMCEAVYKHWLARPTNQDVEDFSRRFGQLYEGTRLKDTKFIIRLIKNQISPQKRTMLHSALPGGNVASALLNHPTAQDNIPAQPVPPSLEPSRRVVSNPNIKRLSAAVPILKTPSPQRSSSVKSSATPSTGRYAVRPAASNRAFSSATPSTDSRSLATDRNPQKNIEVDLTPPPRWNRNQSSDVRRGVIKDTSAPKRIFSGPSKEASLGRSAGKAPSRDVPKYNRNVGEDSSDNMDLDAPESDEKNVDGDVPRYPAKRGNQYLYALESVNKKSPQKPFASSTSANTPISKPQPSRKPVFGGGNSAKDSVNKTSGPGSRGNHSLNSHGNNKTLVPSSGNPNSFVNNKNKRHTGPGTGSSTDRFSSSSTATRKPPPDSTSKLLANTTAEPEKYSEEWVDKTLGAKAVGYMYGHAPETGSDTEAMGDTETPGGHHSSRGITRRPGASVGTGYRKIEGHDGNPQSTGDSKVFGWFPDTPTPTKPAGWGTNKGGQDIMGNETSGDRIVSTSSGDSAARFNQGFGRDTASGSMGRSDGDESGYPGNRGTSGDSGYSRPRRGDGTAVEPAEQRGRLGSAQYSNSPSQRSGDSGIGTGLGPDGRVPLKAPTGPRNREPSGHADRFQGRVDGHVRARPRSNSFGANGMRSDERRPADQRPRFRFGSWRSERDYSDSGFSSRRRRRDS